jgi:peroxiredoxin
VAWAGDESAFRDFVDRHHLTFPHLADSSGRLFDHFGVPTQPAFVVIDPDGTATTLLGSLDDAALDAALTAATADT